MLNSRKTFFFLKNIFFFARVSRLAVFPLPLGRISPCQAVRSGWAGSDPVALAAPFLPRETQQCLLRGWVFAWRLSLINPSWKVIWLNVLVVSFFNFFFF